MRVQDARGCQASGLTFARHLEKKGEPSKQSPREASQDLKSKKGIQQSRQRRARILSGLTIVRHLEKKGEPGKQLPREGSLDLKSKKGIEQIDNAG